MPIQVDLTSQEFFRDPARTIARMREAGPVIEVRLPLIGRVWTTTSYELCNQVLRDDQTFAMRNEGGRLAGLQWWMPRAVRAMASSMLSADDPDHRRLRGAVDEAFHRREILAMEPRIAELADELADRLFLQGTQADVVSRYARILPLSVICELLGLPDEDRPRFSSWAQRFTSMNGPLGFLALVPALKSMWKYLDRRCQIALEQGGHGLIGELARLEREGHRISRQENVAMLFLLLFAGHETTTHLISGSVRELLLRPDLLAWLREDWQRAEPAVEEFLRYVSPVQFTKPRYVRRDVDLGGVQLKRGDRIMPMLAAANHDPQACPHAGVLDLARTPNRHIAFGAGIHFCLGHQLARMEGRCALKALFERWPQLSMAQDDSQTRWRERMGTRALRALPVVAGVSGG